MERRSGAPYFLDVVMRVLKVVEVIWGIDREPLAFCMRRCGCKKYKIWLETSIRSPWLIFMHWFADRECDRK
jgi:hypothetical protein